MNNQRLPRGRRVVLASLSWLLLIGIAAAQPSRELRLERLDITPADAATVSLVTRRIPVGPGDPVDGVLLASIRQDLERSGYFSAVTLYTSRGERPGGIVLHVDVVLDHKVRFLTGFGYQPLDGWYLNMLGARVMNQPRPGSELRLALRSGFLVGGIYLSGRFAAGEHPDDAMLLDLHAQSKDWVVYDRRESWIQGVDSSTLRLGRQLPVGGGITLTAWLGVRTVDPDDTLRAEFTEDRDGDERERPVGDLLDVGLDRAQYVHARLDLSRDRRDPVRPWLDGAWLGTRLDIGQQFDGPHFATLELDGRRSVPVGPQRSLALRLRAAHATDRTPYHDRFQFGGLSTVRGYDVAFLSGPLGASNLVLANLEYRHALIDPAAPTPRLTGVLFIDTGQAWDDGGATAGWVASAGLGFRLRLPWVHLVGVEVGYPLVDVGDMSPYGVNLAMGWSY
jgi:hypothetical protein